jgi:hypothetical protein
MQPSQSSRPRAQVMSIWTLEQARRAIPYIHTLLSGLREHRLDGLSNRLRAHHVRQSGNPRCEQQIESARAAAHQAEERFQEDFEELQALSVYPLNALQGVALLPFIREQHLAWLIFDLFDDDPLRCWRYHDDPPQAVRMLADG